MGLAMEKVLRDPKGKGSMFVKLYYQLLQLSVTQGAEATLSTLHTIATALGEARETK